MTEERELIPAKYRFLSGSMLKLIALVAMLIDHTASVLLKNSEAVLIRLGSHELTLFEGMRCVGRVAFPIYAFLIVEGFLHTGNRKKYGISLLLFALISEIPWDLEHTGKWFGASQNVFFTLFAGYLGLVVLEKYHDKWKKQVAALLGLLLLTILMRADYGCAGFGFILLLYYLRKDKLMQTILGVCLSHTQWLSGLAFIPINLYNGKRGFIHGKIAKYIFYLIYPVHMLILYFLKKQLIGY